MGESSRSSSTGRHCQSGVATPLVLVVKIFCRCDGDLPLKLAGARVLPACLRGSPSAHHPRMESAEVE